MDALRLHQWIKNVLIFVPLVLAHQTGDLSAVLRCVAGFLLMSAVASSTYLLNDLADLQADRGHATKRHRALAAGSISPVLALTVAAGTIVVVLVLAFLLSNGFALALLGYVGLTFAYSLGLRRLPILDVAVIGGLFTLRIVAGVSLVGAGFSIWLLSFSLLFFFSLALVKRHSELVKTESEGNGELAGRGYRQSDWPLTLAAGISSGIASLVIMLLYISDASSGIALYARPTWILAIPTVLLLWILRIWFLAQRGQMHDDPIVFAIGDGYSWAAAFVVAAAFLFATVPFG